MFCSDLYVSVSLHYISSVHFIVLTLCVWKCLKCIIFNWWQLVDVQVTLSSVLHTHIYGLNCIVVYQNVTFLPRSQNGRQLFYFWQFLNKITNTMLSKFVCLKKKKKKSIVRCQEDMMRNDSLWRKTAKNRWTFLYLAPNADLFNSNTTANVRSFAC